MEALKGAWEVYAGIIPGQPMPEFTRRYVYTSKDNEFDQQSNTEHSPAYHSVLCKIRAEAIDYYLQVSNPQILNRATITFIWY